jgi:hypothetical protein
MEAMNVSSPIHFYDTAAHRIACGVRGVDHRSTKHPRTVTCPACVSLLGERTDGGGVAAESADGMAAP